MTKPELPKIVSLPTFAVVGLPGRPMPMSPEIPQLWDTFVPRIGEIQNDAEPHVSYGLMDNFDPATGRFDYLAGIAVTSVSGMPEGMTRWDVPGSDYAVFESSIATLGQTFDFIYSSWLPTSGYVHAGTTYFERYGADFSPDNPRLDVYIPIRARA